MNQRKAKLIRKKSYDLAAVHLKKLLPEEEHKNVTPASIKEFEKEQEKHVFDGDSIRVAPYNSRWFYKKLKKLYKTGTVDFRLKSAKELGVDG